MNPMPMLGLDDIFRFWMYIKKTPDCWIWIGAHSGTKVPQIHIQRKVYYVARISYWLHYKIDPQNQLVCHDCRPNRDNASCVNPDHLWLGTDSENKYDMYAKGCVPVSKSKLWDEEVIEIRQLFDQGMTKAEIARKFHMTFTGVSKIVTRERHVHIP